MSQHSSLRTSRAGRKLRSVLKRYERFLALKGKGILEDDFSVFGMPKLKIIRTKIRKEKAEEKPVEAQAALPETDSAFLKGAAPTKGASAKPKVETAAPKETGAKPKKAEKGKK